MGAASGRREASRANLAPSESSTCSSSSSARPRLDEEFRSTFTEQLKQAVSVWAAGVVDAVKLHQCIIFIVRSERIRVRTIQCFVLNGVIFLGSILLFNWAVAPLLSVVRQLVQDDEAWATDFVGASFSVLYKVLWIYPIYCISFVLNTVMYQEVADEAMLLLQHKPVKAKDPLERLINEAFRVLLNLVYIVEMGLIYYVPLVGPLLYFIHSCWLASIYCFEYRWVHFGWTSNARIEYFERHWLYFAGFGFPVSFISFLSPRFVDAGVFALLFPLGILSAATAKPRALNQVRLLQRLPVFAAVQGVSCLMLRCFEGRLSGPSTPPGQTPTNTAQSTPRSGGSVGKEPATSAEKSNEPRK